MLRRVRVSSVIDRFAGLGILAACGVLLSIGPSLAQRASSDILAKERSDPAAGETVVIINSDKAKEKAAGAKKKPAKRQRSAAEDDEKKTGAVSSANAKPAQSKADAPDPYAPIKLNPLPQERQKAKKAAAKPRSRPPASQEDGDEGRIERFARPRSVAPSRRAAVPSRRAVPERSMSPERLPPLPKLNTEQRTARVEEPRWQQPYNRSERQVRPNRLERTERWERRHPARRSNRRYDHAYGYGDERFRAYGGERLRRHHRPWRVCRQLAWRCEDGFRRACNIWRRRC